MAKINKIRYPKLLPRQQTFSTFDVLKVLDLKRERLRQWMNHKFIPTGSRVEWGSGSKVVFTKSDLYRTLLFKKLVDAGLNRAVASRYMNHVDWSEVGADGYKFLFVIKYGKSMDDERFVYLRKEESLRHLKDEEQGLFINLAKIVEEIEIKV